MTTEDTGITHVSGKDVERTGTEAFIFIDLKGWEYLLTEAVASPLNRWYEQVVKRVWMSFTSAGHKIKKTTFVVILSGKMWHSTFKGELGPLGDLVVCRDGSPSLDNWIEGHLPVVKPIIVTIVRDYELVVNTALSNVLVATNLLALHVLVYHMPASLNVQPQKAYLDECERIYNDDPEGWYRKPVGGEKLLGQRMSSKPNENSMGDILEF